MSIEFFRAYQYVCDNCKCKSPIARSEPRDKAPIPPEGWTLITVEWEETKVRQDMRVCPDCYEHIDQVGLRMIA